MRVVIIGAQGVGKTTLAQEMAKYLNHFDYIKETAREIIREGGGILPQDMKINQRCKFQQKILQAQITAEKNSDNFFSDRSVFDVLAYTKGLPVYNKLYRKALEHYQQNKYDIIFYIPIEFAIQGDAERSADPVYQREIDNNIQELIKKLNLEVIVLTGSEEKRLTEALIEIYNH